MSDFLLDTNHASEVLKKVPHITGRIAAATSASFGLPMPVVAELWFMVSNSRRVSENVANLQSLLDDYAVREFDMPAAEEFGRLKTELRRLGRPIPDVDIQIAAIARLNDLTLLTADAHFRQVPNLRTDNWIV